MVQAQDQDETIIAQPGMQSEFAEGPVRAKLGEIIIRAFVFGLAFFGVLLTIEIVVGAFGGATFLGVDDMVKLVTTFGSIIGPPLGFVISYYFKEEQ